MLDHCWADIMVSTSIDCKYKTLTKCWPNVVFPTNIDTQVRCAKCTLAQCWPNVVQPTPTLQTTMLAHQSHAIWVKLVD